jgi:hypothetical protein
MQGFMVHAKTTGSQTITLGNAARTHTGQDIYYKNTELTSNVLDLKVSGNGYEDFARVCFYDQAASEFDGEFDAFKLFSYNANVPQIYSLTPNQTKLAINTQPALVAATSVPLGIQLGQAGNYSMTFEGLNTFANANISLEDLKDNKLIELGAFASYSFYASAGNDPARFVLHFGSVGIDDPEKSAINIYSYGHNLFISNAGKAMLEIFNIAGQRLIYEQISNAGLYTKTLPVNKGYYLVRLSNESSVKTAKIFIK